FGRALDAVLTIVPFGGKLTDHLIGAGRGRTRNVARRKVHGRSNRKFVLQRPLPSTQRTGRADSPAARPARNPGGSIARGVENWPVTSGHGKSANFVGISAR